MEGPTANRGTAAPTVPARRRVVIRMDKDQGRVGEGQTGRVQAGSGRAAGWSSGGRPHRLCPFYDGKWELINGYVGGTPSLPNQAFANAVYRTADHRWMMPFDIHPNIKVAALRLLGAGEVPEDVAAAISKCADPTAPFDGVRALGMGHIIAGAGAGRAAALHGADVLNLWRPYELEHDVTYLTTGVGVRSATVSPYTREGLARIHELQSGADVFYANRRPGLIHATVSLNGRSGPWKNCPGLDRTAGALTGLLHLEGDGDKPALPPITVNDYLVSWFMRAGIAEALRRRAVDGGSYRVHVSLSRVALWILSMGVFDTSYAEEIAGTGELHAYADPEVFTAETPLGHCQGVTDQVKMSDTPGAYRQILVPRGSQRAQWLPTA